jgi:hypothetical protein
LTRIRWKRTTPRLRPSSRGCRPDKRTNINRHSTQTSGPVSRLLACKKRS